MWSIVVEATEATTTTAQRLAPSFLAGFSVIWAMRLDGALALATISYSSRSIYERDTSQK